MDCSVLNLHSPEVRRDPYPFFAYLRAESPVHWCERTQAFLVSRYADVISILKQPELFSSVAMRRQAPGSDAGTRGTHNMITTDPPEHTRLRGILQKEFLNRSLADIQARIDDTADHYLRRICAQPEFDLVDGFTIPFPVTVIAEMLGVEPERREDFKYWSDCLVQVLTEHHGPAWERARAGVFELVDFFVESFDRRRVEGRHHDDLLSLLLDAENRGDLTPREAVASCTLLLAAGNETTTDLLGNLIPTLLANPEQLEQLLDDPELVPRAVEEGLRHASPVQGIYRRATEDVEIAGTAIPEGKDVVVLFGAANRDQSRFPDPDRFDLRRETGGMVGFGYGIHFCLGAHLARREARSALERLLPKLARLRPQFEQVQWKPGWLVRGPTRLPFAWA